MLYLKKLLLLFPLFTLFLEANSFQSLTSFEAKFSQTITNPSGSEAKYEGLLYIQEPNKIKWQYSKPFEKYVYIKKYTVTVIEPELEQVIVTNLNKEINVLNLLKTAVQKSENSFVSKYNDVVYTIILKDDILQKISYKDEIDNSVSILFSNVKQNHTISDTIFKFRIPASYDVIKK